MKQFACLSFLKIKAIYLSKKNALLQLYFLYSTWSMNTTVLSFHLLLNEHGGEDCLIKQGKQLNYGFNNQFKFTNYI